MGTNELVCSFIVVVDAAATVGGAATIDDATVGGAATIVDATVGGANGVDDATVGGAATMDDDTADAAVTIDDATAGGANDVDDAVTLCTTTGSELDDNDETTELSVDSTEIKKKGNIICRVG